MVPLQLGEGDKDTKLIRLPMRAPKGMALWTRPGNPKATNMEMERPAATSERTSRLALQPLQRLVRLMPKAAQQQARQRPMGRQLLRRLAMGFPWTQMQT